VLRLALCWAAERGIVAKAPIPDPRRRSRPVLIA
jgi:hypothetical protein